LSYITARTDTERERRVSTETEKSKKQVAGTN
jgi:hypothetical protein